MVVAPIGKVMVLISRTTLEPIAVKVTSIMTVASAGSPLTVAIVPCTSYSQLPPPTGVSLDAIKETSRACPV